MRPVILGVVAITLGCVVIPSSMAGPAPSSAPGLRAAVKSALAQPAKSFPDAYVQAVWLQVMSERLRPYVPNPAKRKQLLLLVHAEAVHAGVPPELVLAIINAESNFNPWAVSATGAQGLMQIMPFWLKVAGYPGDNLFDPRTNLRLGCAILAYYLKRSRGNIAAALQGYYGAKYDDHYSTVVLQLLSDRWYWRE